MKYENWNVKVIYSHYANGRDAILLVTDDELQEPVATATVNLVNYHIDPGYAFIPEYKMQGMLKWLQDNNIVGPIVAWGRSGYVEKIPLVKILK